MGRRARGCCCCAASFFSLSHTHSEILIRHKPPPASLSQAFPPDGSRDYLQMEICEELSSLKESICSMGPRARTR